jgi:DNA-binding transcriptional LysR family regulator
MELRHLKYFVAVAEEQNVTRAAARLHVSQPPLSRQIRDLEEELGVKLFERRAKSVRLTEAGKVFMDEARTVLSRAADAVATVRAVANGARGELRVGYAPSLTVQILPLALRRFQESAPGVKVTLHDLSTEAMLSGLLDASLDLALMLRPAAKVRRGLVFEALQRYTVCVAVQPEHPLARARRVSLRKLSSERLIVYTRKDYPEYHDWLADLFKPLGGIPAIGEEHDSVTSLIASIEAGHGVAIVPECLSCLTGPRLKLRPLADKIDPFVVGLARCTGKPAELVSRFVDAAK